MILFLCLLIQIPIKFYLCNKNVLSIIKQLVIIIRFIKNNINDITLCIKLYPRIEELCLSQFNDTILDNLYNHAEIVFSKCILCLILLK